MFLLKNTEHWYSLTSYGKLKIQWNSLSLTCHLHLAYQVHILFFVFLCDQDIGSIWLEVSHFTHPELLDLHTQSTWTLSVLYVLHGFSSIFYWKSQMASINSYFNAIRFPITFLQHLFYENIKHVGFKPLRPNPNFNSWSEDTVWESIFHLKLIGTFREQTPTSVLNVSS